MKIFSCKNIFLYGVIIAISNISVVRNSYGVFYNADYENYKSCILEVCNKADENGVVACSNDLKETQFVTINGAKLRKGKELFQFANVMCSYKIQDQTQKNNYELAFQLDARNVYSYAKIQSYLQNRVKGENFAYNYKFYKECMSKACTDFNTSQPIEFKKCWKPYKRELIEGACDAVLAKSSTPFTLRAELYQDISKSQFDFCIDNPGATFDNDSGKCSFNVEFRGEDGQTVMKSKDFVLGEAVECAQNYFDVDLGVRKEKTGFVLKQILTTVKGAVNIVKAIPNVVTMVVNAVKLTTETAANVVEATNRTSDAIRGGCYINDQFVAHEGQIFLVGPTSQR